MGTLLPDTITPCPFSTQERSASTDDTATVSQTSGDDELAQLPELALEALMANDLATYWSSTEKLQARPFVCTPIASKGVLGGSAAEETAVAPSAPSTSAPAVPVGEAASLGDEGKGKAAELWLKKEPP